MNTGRANTLIDRVLSPLLGTFIFLLFTELFLSLLIPNTYLWKADISLEARLFIFAYSFTLLVGAAMVIGVPILLLREICLKRGLVGHLLKRSLDAVVTLLIIVFLLLYGTSWAFYWQVGKFLDYDALSFWLTQPVQVFHWVDADIILAVIIFTVAASMLVVRYIPNWTRSMSEVWRKRMTKYGTIIIGLCSLFTVFMDLRSHTLGQPYLDFGNVYVSGNPQSTTPIGQALAEFMAHSLRNKTEKQALYGLVHTVRRALISLDQYRANVDLKTSNRWNVILIVVESLRADQLQAYGSHRIVMPAVEALAQKSRVFRNVWAQSSHTSYAVLAPLSSHYPLRSVTRHVYPRDASYPRVLIYDVLKSLGYTTAVFSSSNENWEGMVNYLKTDSLDTLFHAAVADDETYIEGADTGFATWVRGTNQAGTVDDQLTVTKAIKWLEQQTRAPFFLYLNLQSSHLPYRIPSKFPRRFGPDAISFTIRFGHFPQDKANVVKNIYADSLAYIDAQISRLVEYLAQRKLIDKTVIVVTGDHGQAFYEHDFSAHGGKLYEEVMRVPLIIYAPSLKAGIDHRSAQHIDIPPSILHVLGLPTHPSFQGESLLESNSKQGRSIYMVAQSSLAYEYGIFRKGWKLVHDIRSNSYRLHNLLEDPMEMTDLSETAAHIRQDLAARLHSWQKMQVDYYSDIHFHTREYPPIPNY